MRRHSIKGIIIGAVVGNLIGMFIGLELSGMYDFDDFVFSGTRGYEAVSQIGAIIGALFGAVCGLLLTLIIQNKRKTK